MTTTLHSPVKLRFRPGLRLSNKTFWKLCQANPELDLERSAEEELIILPPTGADSDRRNVSITAQLWNWNQTTGLGVAFGPSAGFTLPDTSIRGPDAAWISRERWDALSPEDQKRFAHICPEFVVELRSINDSKTNLRDKMRIYLANGARLGWLIDPVGKSKTVEIYRPDRPVETLKRPETLSGEEVLPGFTLDLKGILFD